MPSFSVADTIYEGLLYLYLHFNMAKPVFVYFVIMTQIIFFYH
jgi:hypothetical protein